MEQLEINPNIHSTINDKIIKAKRVMWNLGRADLAEEVLSNKEGFLTDDGAIVVKTGKFTGRSPKDRYVVEDTKTKDTVFWGDINRPISSEVFDGLLNKMTAWMRDRTLYIRDAYVGADPRYKLNVRVINTLAWHNLFCYNMFIRPTEEETLNFDQNYTIICCPQFKADPETDGVASENFAILNLSEKIILIGGTGYAGEMKKGAFSVLNYLLPQEEGVLSMHCSANIGKEGDTSLFFGLSGTGKTTLSADPNRSLIGDDEHGWSDEGVFNFEGGCYAKVINLTEEQEPDIYRAIKFGAMLENVKFIRGSRTVDFTDTSITQNTRVSYPIHHIENIVTPSQGGIPENVFFLTADAFGILPPISKLDESQAMYHFISGYTAKVAGTEEGVKEPQPVFSACFGEPFMPLHPTKYAEMLGEKMKANNTKVWLINTGWSGGGYGVGARIKLKFTRAMINAALDCALDKAETIKHPVFGFEMVQNIEGVPSELLNPRNTWEDKAAYDAQANKLAELFTENFKKYAEYANESIMQGAPVVAKDIPSSASPEDAMRYL